MPILIDVTTGKRQVLNEAAIGDGWIGYSKPLGEIPCSYADTLNGEARLFHERAKLRNGRSQIAFAQVAQAVAAGPRSELVEMQWVIVRRQELPENVGRGRARDAIGLAPQQQPVGLLVTDPFRDPLEKLAGAGHALARRAASSHVMEADIAHDTAQMPAPC